MTRRTLHTIATLLVSVSPLSSARADEPIAIGSQRELFVDRHLVGAMNDTVLRLHTPVAGEVAIAFDAPWEGNTSGYVTVFQDEDRFRMYYRGSHYDRKTKKYSSEHTCYAESRDGIVWTKPELGLFEYNGSKRNNIVWKEHGTHNFTPFKDANPNGKPDARYKALAGDRKGGLLPFYSSDGIHWTRARSEPVITDGAFDSQNLAFWDEVRGRYVAFFRDFRDGIRDIKTCTSEDFIHWTKPQWLDWGQAPPEHLYTNAVTPYFRAPHILIGFPMRFVPHRKVAWSMAGGVSDSVFMAGRDGLHWHRWPEAFLRPGQSRRRWASRNNMIAWGVLQTKSAVPESPDELSIYAGEGYYYLEAAQMRRYTLRLDGFVSVHASASGGEIITKTITFTGKHLRINYATSAAGSVRIELQDASGKPIPGYDLNEAVDLYGDEIDAVVSWQQGNDVGKMAGKPVRLRAVMKDANWYAFQFVGSSTE